MLDNLFVLLSTTEGRASRRHWWAAMAVYVLIAISAFIISVWSENLLVAVIVFSLYGLTIIGCFLVSIRRLHDLNLTGLLVLVYLIPFAGPVVLFVLLGLLPGTSGKNAYGEPFLFRRRPPSHAISQLYATSSASPPVPPPLPDSPAESS